MSEELFILAQSAHLRGCDRGRAITEILTNVGKNGRDLLIRELGYPWTYLTVAGQQVEIPDITQPIYGSSTTTVDLMAG